MVEHSRTDGIQLEDLLSEVVMADSTLPNSLTCLEIEGLQLDSRKIKPGHLFIAVPGFDRSKPSDGRSFVAQAVANGAVAVLAEQIDWQENWKDSPAAACSVPIVLIPGLSGQISGIAGEFYGQPSDHIKVIGITGTNGKTTCSHLLAQLFNTLDLKTAVVGTLGYGVPGGASPMKAGASVNLTSDDLISTNLTTPDPIAVQKILADMRADGVASVAMEVSSHSLDQGRVNDVHMQGAVFTNLSRDHLDYHGSMDEYLLAKQKLFATSGLEFAVINIDDPAGLSLVQSLDSSIKCFSYSLSDSDASVCASNVRLSAKGLEAGIDSPWGEARLKTRLIGEFNLGNILAVISVACASGQEFGAVIEAVTELVPVAGRLEVISSGAGPMVVVDYAHTPDALAKALGALRSIHNQAQGQKLWCVFGCGGGRDKGKRPEMAAIAELLADEVIVTSDNPRHEKPADIIGDILSGTKRPFHSIEDRAEAIRFAISNALPEDTILIAGKGHEDYQITGDKRLPFSDSAHARLALRNRGADSA
jgi:UDP-N-acetylmuramoyl-L-alanyl-D-glutamate--2,6-diaminopimelate ligase